MSFVREWLDTEAARRNLPISNVQMAELLWIDSHRPAIAAWAKALYGSTEKAVQQPGLADSLLVWCVYSSGPPDARGMGYAVLDAAQRNLAEQALMAMAESFVPEGWTPTPSTDKPGSGDMSTVLKPLPALLQSIITRLVTNPQGDALVSVASDLAALAGGSFVGVSTGLDLTRYVTYVLCPPELQSGTDTYHGALEQELRDPNDPGRLWTSTLPPMPVWLTKLQGPIVAAVQAGAVQTDPFKEVRRPTEAGLKWFKPTWSESGARAMASAFLAHPWTQANYPDVLKVLQKAGY